MTTRRTQTTARLPESVFAAPSTTRSRTNSSTQPTATARIPAGGRQVRLSSPSLASPATSWSSPEVRTPSRNSATRTPTTRAAGVRLVSLFSRARWHLHAHVRHGDPDRRPDHSPTKHMFGGSKAFAVHDPDDLPQSKSTWWSPDRRRIRHQNESPDGCGAATRDELDAGRGRLMPVRSRSARI